MMQKRATRALLLAAAFLCADGGTAVAAAEEHGLSQGAVELARPFGFPITNSMVVTWIVALGLIVFAQIATRKMQQVPDGSQNFLEWLVESLYNFLEGLLGPRLVARTFWFFASVFIFILAANWAGLFPGIGSIGWGHQTATGFRIEQPLLRGANADVNMTMAMALVFFASWIVWGLREVGPVGFFKELFAPKGESAGLMRLLLGGRLLRGRVPRGRLHSLPADLSQLSTLRQHLRWRNDARNDGRGAVAGMARQIPVLLSRTVGGLVQALVFMLLTAVFTLLICQHHEGPCDRAPLNDARSAAGLKPSQEGRARKHT
jgi:F-type H+-transporting ATPase subunit a